MVDRRNLDECWLWRRGHARRLQRHDAVSEEAAEEHLETRLIQLKIVIQFELILVKISVECLIQLATVCFETALKAL